MIQLLKRCGSLSLFSLSLSCAQMQISDFQVFVALPASGDCFGIRVLSKKEVRLKRSECEDLVKRGLILTSENWRLIRGDIQTNCQNSQCLQLTGRFDNLFIAIDKGLQQVPK